MCSGANLGTRSNKQTHDKLIHRLSSRVLKPGSGSLGTVGPRNGVTGTKTL